MKYYNSYFVLFPQKYQALPLLIKKNRDIVEFKNALKLNYVPKRYKFLSQCDKKGDRLLTQIRVGRLYLNSHTFSIQMLPSPECSCHFPNESTTHFFINCFMWTEERQTMLGVFEYLIPSFLT